MREFYRRRSDSERLVQVNLNEIIHEVIELTRPRWRDISQREGISIQIQTELDPKLPLLSSDPSELREALMNLVFNAVDAMPQGGTITFVTRSIDISRFRTKTKIPDDSCWWRSKTLAPAWTKRYGNTALSRFFPPSRFAAARVWVWRWFTAWCNVTKAT